MALDAAKGREFDHVLVLGLQSSRMPGARRAAVEPIPDALLHEELPPDTREAHVAEMRRLLYLGMTRAREGLVLAYSARTERGALQPPSPFAEEARAAAGGEWRDRGEELFGPDEALHAAFSELRDELLRDVPRVGGTLGELRLDTDLEVAHGVVRYLELRQARGAAARGPRARASPTRCPGRRRARAGARAPQQREMLESSPLDELAAERRARRARPRRGDRARAPSRRSRRSCRAAARGWCSAPRTSTRTGRAR